MNNETRASESDTIGTRGLSRRTLVRTAAWSVPVISTVAAAPAFAAASDKLVISLGTPSPSWSTFSFTNDYVTASITLKNDSPNDLTNNLQLTMTIPNVYVWGPSWTSNTDANRSISFSSVPAAWGTPTVDYSGSGSGRTATVVFNGPAIASGGTSTLSFRLTTQRDVGNISGLYAGLNSIDTISPITVSALAENGSSFVVTGLTSLNPS